MSKWLIPALLGLFICSTFYFLEGENAEIVPQDVIFKSETTSGLIPTISKSAVLKPDPTKKVRGDSPKVKVKGNLTPKGPSYQVKLSQTSNPTVGPSSTPTVGSTTSPIASPRSETKKVPNCLEVRGSSGKWIYDLSYSAEAQYFSPLNGPVGKANRDFSSSATVPYLPASTYRWQDSFESCQTALFTPDGICKVLNQLNITRVFFVGDSLNFMMAQSFWKLFGSYDDPGGYGFERVLNCDHVANFKVVYIRNDHLTKEGKTRWTCGDFCDDWLQKYMSSQERTLFVANTGAHIHELDVFQHEFDAFLDLMDTIRHGNDIMFFRTTVPGHVNCGNHHAPFSNHSEAEVHTKNYAWEKFEFYNQYAKQRLQNKSDWFALDVYPMTVLRPDGHCSADDCLHYMLPGPPDWWNHLLYSNLVDIAS